MKNLLNSKLLMFVLLLAHSGVEAQPAMGDTFRSEGKIYVVVGVVVLIFAVLFAYLISIDRRLKKMEKEKGEQ